MTVPPLHVLQQQLVSCSHESSEFQGLGQPWDLEKSYWPVHDLKCVLVPPDGLSNSPEFPQGNREAELVYRLRGSHRGPSGKTGFPATALCGPGTYPCLPPAPHQPLMLPSHSTPRSKLLAPLLLLQCLWKTKSQGHSFAAPGWLLMDTVQQDIG